ncbi:DMSO/TMAO reductase YedYZ molybdopterin-dependent catalytic subunit [Evansella vedderi]|uniref:DMSO/TMAO reductase YedYZ molybdopterin-dependent catalytic subunit n=1 Tax=Evansella vedderi TaxID=38282 RepID=A0ABT9ZV76_9BACI|nr:sulfite oxidase [Evansella vedderi]MDQ0255142.1 DMSO/TMAO reductase YedYZ molybdopterin-dependent catalytic subunit [Evansella vedderi]
MYNRSVRPFLTTRSLAPENQESPIHFLTKPIISYEYFYLRNHFNYPTLKEENFFFSIGGEVTQPQTFHLYDLLQMPKRKVLMLLECAGNKRSKFEPKVYGEQWEEGAISQGVWEGVSLKDLFQYTGLKAQAKEIVFEGYDFGEDKSKGKYLSYKRSLPLSKALHEDTIIAYKYNDQPISLKHGAPFRLIVPHWYGMASVKWVKSMDVVSYSFQGPYQTEDYVYYPYEDSDIDAYPVTTINVNSIIKAPLNFSILKKGEHTIKGIAWTGMGNVRKVELSLDHGQTWMEAKIEQEIKSHYSWVSWTFLWEFHKPGEYTLLCRAIDSHNRAQPMEAFWNRKGYGYNRISEIKVKIEG